MARSVQYKNYLSQYFRLEKGESRELNPITLSVSSIGLDEVEVRAMHPLVEIQPDKTVFNIDGNLNAATGDALEILRKAPGVLIDNNNNILLLGKNGVKIYIDDKPGYLTGDDLVSMLRGMSAGQIKSIEIITNPSAKYEADGNAGIINIVLKRNKNFGFNGKVSANASISTKQRYTGDIVYNYRNRKMNVYGNFGYHDNMGISYMDIYKEQNGFILDQDADRTWLHRGHNLRTGVDYLINDHQTIGVLAQANVYKGGLNKYSHTAIIDAGNVTNNILVASYDENNTVDNVNANINYQLKMASGMALNFDADYGYFDRGMKNYLPNRYLDPSETIVEEEDISNDIQDTRIDIKTMKGDLDSKFIGGVLSAGFKYSNVSTTNNFDSFIHNGDQILSDTNRSSDFDYTETVYAAYTNFKGTVGKKFTYNAGLRIERTESEGILESEKITFNDDVKRSYTDLFPSGGLAYDINESNNVSFNYSKRIDRPKYNDLNPFEFKLDQLTGRKGNPFLKPQYTKNFQLKYSWKHKLNTSISYSITKDYFAMILDTTGALSSLISQQNITYAKNFGLNANYSNDITKWWNVYSNFNLFHVQYKTNYKNLLLTLDATSYNIYLQNNLLLPANFKMEISGWYNSPSVWGGTVTTKSMWSVNLGLKRSFWRDRLLFTLGVQDIFRSQIWKSAQDYGGIKTEGIYKSDSRRLNVKAEFNFGNQNVEKIRNNRKTGLEEESGRIGD